MLLGTVRRLATLGALALVTATTACGSDGGTGPTGGIAGVYALQSAGGERVPHTWTETEVSGGVTYTYRETLNSGILTLSQDSAFQLVMDWSYSTTTSDNSYSYTESETHVDNGTWAVVNGNLRVILVDTIDTSPVVTVTDTAWMDIAGTKLIADDANTTYVFQKQ